MDFQSEKSFGKLRLRALQPYHQILCMSKHVEDVKDHLWHLWHALIYTVFDGMVEKPSVSASQNFLRIENQLIIKKVMSINVCVCSFLIFDIFDIHNITALRCIWSIFDTFDIALISCINLSQHLQHQTICIDTCPLMYTQQIRWQCVTMGVNEWLPHYLIRSRSHSNSKG